MLHHGDNILKISILNNSKIIKVNRVVSSMIRDSISRVLSNKWGVLALRRSRRRKIIRIRIRTRIRGGMRIRGEIKAGESKGKIVEKDLQVLSRLDNLLFRKFLFVVLT